MSWLNDNGLERLWANVVAKLKTKVNKEDGKGLSTNDFTTEEKEKLAGIDAGANKIIVENSLTSTSESNALSAAQGKILDEKIRSINTNMEDLGAGDMLKSSYDVDNNGQVDKSDDSDKLGGQLPSYYAKATDIPSKVSDLENDVPYLTEHQDISGKVDKVSGKGLSTNDYTNEEKEKLSGIETGANKTVVDSSLSDNSTNPVQNKVIKAELDSIKTSKADASHNHDSDYDKNGSAAGVQANLDDAIITLNSHTGSEDIHVTAENKSNWSTAYTHSQASHARVDATKVADSTTNGNILINDTETNVYTHPTSGITAGTYKSVTVDADGHVTSGSNPTTLSGYGITDAAAKSDLDSVSDDLSSYKESNDAEVAEVRAIAEAATTVTDVETQINNKIVDLNLESAYEPIGAEGRAKKYADELIADANLSQYTTEDEVKSIIDGVIAGAADSETYNSLSKLVDYIDAHGGEASDMAEAIDALEGKVTDIEDKPAYSITETQVSNWDKEVGAKALAETKTTTEEVKTQIEAYGYATSGSVDSKVSTAQATAVNHANDLNTAMDSRMQAVESGVSNSATKEELNAVEEALTEHIESIDLTVYETKTDAENKLTAANKYTDDTVASEREYIDTALAGKSGTDHKHDNLYDHIGASETALTTAKEYTDKAVSGKSDNTHTHDEKYDELGAAEGALKTAKEYTDTLIAGKSDATHNHNDVYYTEAEIDAMVFITVDDIDEIVGSSIVSAVGREY